MAKLLAVNGWVGPVRRNIDARGDSASALGEVASPFGVAAGCQYVYWPKWCLEPPGCNWAVGLGRAASANPRGVEDPRRCKLAGVLAYVVPSCWASCGTCCLQAPWSRRLVQAVSQHLRAKVCEGGRAPEEVCERSWAAVAAGSRRGAGAHCRRRVERQPKGS